MITVPDHLDRGMGCRHPGNASDQSRLRSNEFFAPRVAAWQRMPAPSRKSNADHRRALGLLAKNADGCAEAIMLVHRVTIETLVDMVRTGLATSMTWCSVDSATLRFVLASSAIRCRCVDRFLRATPLASALLARQCNHSRTIRSLAITPTGRRSRPFPALAAQLCSSPS
jgi:hypothetical protein